MLSQNDVDDEDSMDSYCMCPRCRKIFDSENKKVMVAANVVKCPYCNKVIVM